MEFLPFEVQLEVLKFLSPIDVDKIELADRGLASLVYGTRHLLALRQYDELMFVSVLLIFVLFIYTFPILDLKMLCHE